MEWNKLNRLACFLHHDKSRLLQLSCLLLFVELVLIRWAGSNIYFLSFFSNFVLIASFLGIGMGFIRDKSSVRLLPFAPFLLTVFVFLCYHFRYQYQFKMDEIGEPDYVASLIKNNLFPIFISLPFVFVMVAAVMAAIADETARIFQQFPPLQAYRLDIIGSLIGTGIFSLFAYFHASPWWWGTTISLLFISLLKKDWHERPLLTCCAIIALLLTIIFFIKETPPFGYYWSPYYKINVQPFAKEKYIVDVNGVPQQIIEPLEERKLSKPLYFSPYQHRQRLLPLNKVLVIGAGTGGDVAIALAEGAKHIDAVEIDPYLYQLGKRLNVNHPYFDPRVHIFIDDGRAFLQQHHTQYDMIIFALPDSLMVVAGQSSLRLENYLFTLESLQQVKNHLTKNGIFTLYNYYSERWLLDRLAFSLATVFKHAPCLDRGNETNHWLSALLISPSSTALACNTPWFNLSSTYITPATDNRPFVYVKEKKLSGYYIGAFIFVLLCSWTAMKRANMTRQSFRNYLDFFLMGSAFMLLETRSIAEFALLFGTTWFVNALVFTAILTTIYGAIEIANRCKLSPVFLYLSLLLLLLAAWTIPSAQLLSLPLVQRFLVASLLTFSPIFVANLIFAERFRATVHLTEAFGMNILGGVAGGLLEYSSLFIGYRNLLLLTALLYSFAIFIVWYKQIRTARASF